MRYDVSAVLVDHRGRKLPLNEQDIDKGGQVVQGSTLRDVLELLCMAPNEAVKTAEQKLTIYRVLQRIAKADPELELEAGEVELLEKMAANRYPAALYGVVFDVLEAPRASGASSREEPAAGAARRSAGRGK